MFNLPRHPRRPFRVWTEAEIAAWHTESQRRDTLIVRWLYALAVALALIGATCESWLPIFGL